MTSITILHSDRDQVVIEKPYGLLSVPGKDISDSVLTRLHNQGFPTALVVHRLDMLTTGIMVFALRRKAESELERQFRDRLIKKEYVAWVAGDWSTPHGVIDLPLCEDGKDPTTGWPRHKVDLQNGKPAQTQFEVIRKIPSATLLKLMPTTGRSHQLRVHCSAQGHPLVGDPIYGTQKASRMYLHASMLSWFHPYSQAPMSMTCSVPWMHVQEFEGA